MTAHGPHLPTDDLRRLCETLYARTGMLFGESKRYYIERRLYDRMSHAGADSVAAYLGLLRHDEEEAARLISAFTVNETYFYREDHQLRCLVRNLLPEVIRGKRAGDKVRIWSQPCSTGEEAYSIALWLLENWPLVDAYNIEIVGSDIDRKALDAARNGVYGPRSLARLSDDVVKAYFEPVKRGARRIIQDLRESVIFTESNLVDAASMATQGAFDIVFCRNVLIYFDDASRARAAELLYASLIPGAFLCLGHTESMARIDDRFTMRRFPDAIVYQRPEAD